MTFRFLIDECLSPELVDLAIAAGHAESTSLRDRHKLGIKDWELMRFVIEHDFTLVTINAQDFRGKGTPAPTGYHADEELHAGLVCLTSELFLDLDGQRALFQVALKVLADVEDLVNRALEVHQAADGSIEIVIYEIPVE